MDQNFAPLPQGGEPADETLSQLSGAVLEFVRVLNTEAQAAMPPDPPPAEDPMEPNGPGMSMLLIHFHLCCSLLLLCSQAAPEKLGLGRVGASARDDTLTRMWQEKNFRCN